MTTHAQPRSRRVRPVAAARSAGLVVVLLASAAMAVDGPAGAAQGTGNPSLTVSTPRLPADRVNTITVRGIDYLVPPHVPGTSVFGGVYLFFGWVKPGNAWGPSFKTSTSNDGNFGYTYTHAGDGGDGSTRDDGSGLMRLVSFTSGGESGSATAFHMDDAGNWATTLTVRGPTYAYQDPATGANRTVDCRVVQCGVYTIGAHGKSSRTNERFAPITFTTATQPPSATAPPAAGAATDSGRAANATGGTSSATAAPTLPDAGGAAGTTTTVPSDEKQQDRSGTGKQNGWGPAETPEAGDGVLASGPTEDDGGGGTSALPWVAAIVVIAGAGGGVWFLRRRPAAGR